ncbi:MAG: response regulator transcription factor [Firmicutes bacterium]|nr:response regulator transcription factor [Bacillota bacterium]
MPRILIVEDDELIRKELKEFAEFDGFSVVEATNGFEGVTKAREQEFDAVIMDTNLPKLNGFLATKEIKKSKDVPIVMICSRADEHDELYGFEVGASDFVKKPFSTQILFARIEAVIRRGKRAYVKRVASDGLEVDIGGRTVFVDGKKCEMTPKEYELLFYLVANAGTAITRDKLLTDVWGFDFHGDDRTVDTHIKMLRSSLGPYRDKIVTLRGLGYKIEM